MAHALPSRPNLDWLRKTAKQKLRELRAQRPAVKLAEAQLALAREHGFGSWRALKAHIDSLNAADDPAPPDDATVARLLHDARAGDIAAVRDALAKDSSLIHATGPHPFWGGRPQALHMAIEGNQREVFDLLLANGADVRGDNAGYSHWSPLMLAIGNGRDAMRHELERRGAPVLLIEALMLGDDRRVAAMLATGRRALPSYSPGGGSILSFARTVFAIDCLIELGVPLDTEDQWQTAPIQAMSRLGKRGQPLVRRLLEHGVRASPPEYARLGDQETLQALMAADPGVIHDEDVLMGAVDFAHLELAKWLLEHGANPNARSSVGSRGTALHSAAWEGNLPMVKLLAGAGAKLDALDDEHRGTPARWARVSVDITGNEQCREVAEYLEGLAAGAA